jgi:hypothetical protein
VPLAVPNVLATALVNGIGIAGTLVGWEVGTGLDIEWKLVHSWWNAWRTREYLLRCARSWSATVHLHHGGDILIRGKVGNGGERVQGAWVHEGVGPT